jgi:D-alanyl-D-alanine endopeptidase (penicillin-binding protein 7)
MFWNLAINLILSLFLVRGDFAPAVYSDAPLIALKPGAAAVELAAEKGAVLSAQDHFFLFTKRADEVQPIASITKLMTSLVFLDSNPGWEEIYEIKENDKVEGGRLNLFLGEKVKVKDLFYTSLVASDNGATIALVHSTGLSEEEFVARMNAEAKRLGLVRTKFSDPVGLGDDNVSTAREVALLAKAAFDRREIREATASREYNFTTFTGVEKKVESTDYLLFDSEKNSFQVLGGKTGYTDKAGYCFVSRLKDGNREVIAVVLNSAGKNERFKESKNLVNWVFNNYDWKKD